MTEITREHLAGLTTARTVLLASGYRPGDMPDRTISKLIAQAKAAPAQDVATLLKVVDQLANGSHLDSVPNHDNDSLRELAYRCDGEIKKQLLRHADRIDAALLAQEAPTMEPIEVVAYVSCESRMTLEGWENGDEYAVLADHATDADRRYDVPLMTVAQHRRIVAAITHPAPSVPAGKFRLGDRVRKIKGSQWQGRVVGRYSTELTPEGYAVESEAHSGSVQIYPAAALEACDE